MTRPQDTRPVQILLVGAAAIALIAVLFAWQNIVPVTIAFLG